MPNSTVDRGKFRMTIELGELFPNEVAMAVVRMAENIGTLSVKLRWKMGLELLREKKKLNVEMQRYLSEALRALENGIEEISGRIYLYLRVFQN
jgi:hypothetical protein